MNNRRQQTGCFGHLLNLITGILILFTILVIGLLGIMLLAPDLLSDTPFSAFQGGANSPVELPTIAEVAVIPTISDTATPALIATWTPIIEEPTSTPLPTNTQRPRLTPTPSPTLPTITPTFTPTSTPTQTGTPTPPGPTPTPSPTRSAFPFTKSASSPFYLQNSANNAGCDWMGIAGEVLNLERNPVAVGSYRVHVWGNGLDERAVVGGAPAYSQSGWEQFLFNAPTVREYNVQLETSSGTAVSQVYTIQTRASCSQNLTRFDFLQNH